MEPFNYTLTLENVYPSYIHNLVKYTGNNVKLM